MCVTKLHYHHTIKRMSANSHNTGTEISTRTSARVAAVPVSFLPLVGIIILLGLVFNILGLIIR